MVMMGQQLMDSERKQEDDDIDDYNIKPPNNHANRTTGETKQQNSTQEKMKKGEVPTLATLAEKIHQKHVNNGAASNADDSHTGEGDNNSNEVIRQIVALAGESIHRETCLHNGAASSINGDKLHQPQEQVEARTSNIAPSSQTSTTIAGAGGEVNSLSGRTSSCDSSGVGTSLTSSSSSEPIEREEIETPSSENGTVAVPPAAATNGLEEDVPDNGGNVGSTPKKGTANLPNGIDEASNDGASCQVIMLAEDFAGQMTAAKRFLKMVRDGINENGSSGATPSTSSRIGKGTETSADEETTQGASANKSTILTNNSTAPNTPVMISRGVGVAAREGGLITTKGVLCALTRKDKVAGPTVSVGVNTHISAVAAMAKAANGIGSVAALNHHAIQEKGPPPSCVQEVWAHNLLEEFAKIRQIVKKYNFIAMDTEFPGIVVRPQCAVRGAGVFPYELLKVNVDRLKIIQLGVTFMDKFGRCPPGVCTWQFNFKFSLNKDLYASDSISLLTRCGIQFERHAEMGIEPEMFGEYFMSSGMVTTDQVTYLTFHSGFDFGYLIKLLSNLPLPENEERFFEIMKIYFPNVYDLKFLMKSVDLHGGLQDIANQMGQERVGTQHQAGSDSLLTGMTFFKLLSTDVFNGEIDEAKYCGKLYGFHMNEDGTKDDGWSEMNSDMMDATSPKPPPPTSRTTSNNGTTSNLLHPLSQSSQHSSATGNNTDNR